MEQYSSSFKQKILDMHFNKGMSIDRIAREHNNRPTSMTIRNWVKKYAANQSEMAENDEAEAVNTKDLQRRLTEAEIQLYSANATIREQNTQIRMLMDALRICNSYRKGENENGKDL